MTVGWTDADLHVGDPLRRLAARIGCSTGQAWTLVGGLVLGTALLAASVLRGPGVAQDAAGGLGLPPLLAPLPAAAAAPTTAPPAPDPGTAPPALALPAPAVVPSDAPVAVPALPGLLPAAPAEPAPAVVPSRGPSPTATSAGPLRIARGGWTGRDSTRGSARGFPASDFPVSADALGESRHSFVRLTGSGLRLVLRVDPSAGATAGTPRVRACPTRTASWAPGPEQPTAPPYADTPCAAGVPSSDGRTYVFDLSALPDPTGEAGVSLVPAPAADPATAVAPFQIAFLPAPGATP